ncbi:MAG: hypothetical protein IMZ43_05490 [Thermoplasmata archaeon]|nr:hypothetical protein [Thermoplasmata archaeon]MBE3136830.1 hypothetical protein [Thermoplasmata archaeon]MBE3140916.1 hypothetical protein [Thermoplasmata archaeon]
MKKISSAMVKMAVVLLAVFSLIIAANAGYVSSNLKSQKTTQMMNTKTDFYANITFNVYEGEGCGCVPLRSVPLNATGRDTDHFTSGVTDDNGTCVLQLEYDKTYRVSIQAVDHESVLFDFVVLDNQAFSFHMKVIDTSSYHFSFLQMMLQKIVLAKKTFNVNLIV